MKTLNTLLIALLSTSSIVFAAPPSEQKLKEERIRCESFSMNKPVAERPAFVEQCLKTLLEPTPAYIPGPGYDNNYQMLERDCLKLYGKDSKFDQMTNRSWFATKCRKAGIIH